MYQVVISDCNWTRTQNLLFLKRTLNYLAKRISFLKSKEDKLDIEKLETTPVHSDWIWTYRV